MTRLKPKAYVEYIFYYDGINHNVAQIGEKVNHLLKLNPDVHITQARNIVNLRNRLSHAYDSIRPEMIWAIVINHIPLLKQELNIDMSHIKSGCNSL